MDNFFTRKGLYVKRLPNNENYVYGEYAKNRYSELIDNLDKIATNDRKHDCFTILLGFPCKFPNGDENRHGYGLYFKSNDGRLLNIFCFTSVQRINIQSFIKPFILEIELYNQIYGTNYKIYVYANYHFF